MFPIVLEMRNAWVPDFFMVWLEAYACFGWNASFPGRIYHYRFTRDIPLHTSSAEEKYFKI